MMFSIAAIHMYVVAVVFRSIYHVGMRRGYEQPSRMAQNGRFLALCCVYRVARVWPSWGLLMNQTIDESGAPVLIEAVYYRYGVVYARDDFDTVEEAIACLVNGEDYGALSSVGVFVDGEPRFAGSFDPYAPNAQEAEDMRADYQKVWRS